MNLTWDQYKAAGRHVASYAAGGVTVAVTMGLLTNGQGADLNSALSSIVDGVGHITAGLVTIAGIVTPFYTAWRSSHSANPSIQAASITASVPGTVVIGPPQMANDTPGSPNVISNTDVKVVPK